LGFGIPAVAACLFVVLATANAGGYRYGVSDQAFYIPAFVRALNPAAFPRDAALIDSQARLMVLDGIVALLARATGLSLAVISAAGYFASLLLIFAALLRIARSLYVTTWGTVALAAAFTLRHQITRTSVNSFEPYFHPRMLAFALGALAVAEVLRRRSWRALLLVACAAVIHVTTAIWFAALLGTAVIVADRSLRPLLGAAALLLAGAGAWAVTSGPLAGSLATIDPGWRQLLETKDTLFPQRWPIAAWAANLGTAAVWGWAYWTRRAHRAATVADTGLAAGGALLVAGFLITVPLVAAGVWLFVELQISRVFWLVDFLATAYAISALELRWPARRGIAVAAVLLVALSAGRGAYILAVEHPERSLFAFMLPPSPWNEAMQWLARTPLDTHVLADPGHAYRFGTSVRVSAGRDVFLEEVKDTAIAIYSREVAMRVIERTRALGDFNQLTAPRARALAAQYGLDYLVTAKGLDLPVVYHNEQLTVYALR
jgi:hypothetical protein